MTLSVRIFGTNEYAKNVDHLFLMIDSEKDPVVSNPAPKYVFPFLAAEGFYISLKRVSRHLIEGARKACSNLTLLGNLFKSALASGMTLKPQLMLHLAPRFTLTGFHLFQRVSNFLCLFSRESVVRIDPFLGFH